MILESKIQKSIRDALEARGWLVTKLIRCSEAGWPDLMAIRSGIVVFIEVKRPGCKPTKLQEHRMNQLRRKGAWCFTLSDAAQVAHIDTFRPTDGRFITDPTEGA
jgi:Holliday junction resolvase-like predicted endonuclease